ncbi:hypothetical protein D3C71_1459220 [compost metagenome]
MRGVGGHGGHKIVFRVTHRLSHLARLGRAPHFDLEQIAVLEAFHQHPVHALVQLGQQVVHAERGRLLELAHQHQALVRSSHHLERPGFAVAIGVLARMVDVKAMVRMLDHRHAQPPQPQLGDQLLDQRGLATARKAGKTDNLHGMLLD